MRRGDPPTPRRWSLPTERTAGRAATGVGAFAEAWGADLVAMGTHGRSGVARAVIGSVADKVLRSADRPVFLFRPMRVAPEVALPEGARESGQGLRVSL